MSDFLENGLFEFQKGNFKIASEYFTEALHHDVTDELEALYRRSTCYLELGKFDKSLQDANKILESYPKSTKGYFLAGNALTKLEKFEEALSIFRMGLEIDENDLEIKTGLRNMQSDIMSSFEKTGKENTYNAITMSSQDPYPGDNELETLEKEILEKWGVLEFPAIKMSMHDPQRAIQEYKAAVKLRQDGKEEQAIEKLKVAINHDAANFTYLGEMAVLLHGLGRDKEAFQYCNSIPPDFRALQYWKLGGKILDSLGLPVHAESWLRQGCRLYKDDMEMKLHFQNIRVQRLYGPLTQGTKVNVVFTQYGRAVHASEKIEPGENCFRDKPVVLAQTLDTMQVQACSHCAKNLMRAEEYFGKELLSKNNELRKLTSRFWPVRPKVGCKKCGDKTIYCSTECRDESWSQYHEVLCVSVNPVVKKLHDLCHKYKDLSTDSRCWKGYWNASFSPFVLAKVWASVISLANTLASQNGRDKPSNEDWTMAKSPFRKFIAYGSSGNAKIIPKMLTLMQEIFDNEYLPENMRYKITSREFDGRYFQATCNCQAFSDPMPPFNVFMSNVASLNKRDFVRPFVQKDPDEAMFAGMFPLHACLNHSCDNNVEVLDGHPGVLVRARRPIKKGEELFTTYINTRLARKERRAWLFRGYNFWCQCKRCEFEGDGPEQCTQCGKSAKDEDKEKYPGCSKCHRAWYCSTDCQKIAWKKGHKKICSMPHSETIKTDEFVSRFPVDEDLPPLKTLIPCDTNHSCFHVMSCDLLSNPLTIPR